MHVHALTEDCKVQKSLSSQASWNKNGVFPHTSTFVMLILAAWLQCESILYVPYLHSVLSSVEMCAGLLLVAARLAGREDCGWICVATGSALCSAEKNGFESLHQPAPLGCDANKSVRSDCPFTTQSIQISSKKTDSNQ